LKKSIFLHEKTYQNFFFGLKNKGRIIKINRTKYYLIPIKAKSGFWSEDPFIIVDEMCNGKDYFIGGWSAANYWRLTDQIPMQIDIYTTRRQGKTEILHTRILFHRTTKKMIEKSVEKERKGHKFKIQNIEDSKKWMKSRR
jgi:predicted transcriptional regulator of viral defense system